MPCPYLSGRVEQQLFAELSGAKALDAFDVLSQGGFRRSHHIIYKPGLRRLQRMRAGPDTRGALQGEQGVAQGT